MDSSNNTEHYKNNFIISLSLSLTHTHTHARARAQTHTKDDFTSAQCVVKCNISVTGYKQRTVDFPQLKQCQGQPKTPQSVSVRVKERHRTPYSWRDADSHDGRQNEAVLWIPIKYRVQTMNVSLRPSSVLVVQRQTKHDQNSPALNEAVTEPTHLSIRGNWAT